MAGADLTGETKTLTARCYCHSVHFELRVPSKYLPLEVHLCHCSICRHTHGTLCIFHAPLPQGTAPEWVGPSGLGKLTKYRHSSAKSDRYFCSNCGCHIGDVGIDDLNWVISTSIFDDNKDDQPPVWHIKSHVNTNSAPGGGLYDWLPTLSDAKMIVQNPKNEEEGQIALPPREYGPDGQERLRAECHCGGVSFFISRPALSMEGDPEYSAWLSPLDSAKWMGALDVCDDCRLQSGSHAVGWTFVPQSLISPEMPADLSLGTSKTFVSSTGVVRTFCGTCGAMVAGHFDNDGTRTLSNGDRILDIAVGILRAPDGPLAEEWLTWRTGYLSFTASGMRYDSTLTQSLSDGFAEWSRKTYGKVNSFSIG